MFDCKFTERKGTIATWWECATDIDSNETGVQTHAVAREASMSGHSRMFLHGTSKAIGIVGSTQGPSCVKVAICHHVSP
eukprot:5423930-Amphidinium_carterae.1